MKKRILLICVLWISMASNLIFGLPVTFRNKVNVSFTSIDSIENKKIGDSSLKKYCCNGNLFICDANNFSEVTGSDRKNEAVIGNFRLYVYTKTNQIKYTVNSIKIKTVSNEFDMRDILFMPYPYGEPLQTEFEVDKQNPDYYISRYLLGYFKFPAKKNESVKIILTVECEGESFELIYDYTVKKSLSFITFND